MVQMLELGCREADVEAAMSLGEAAKIGNEKVREVFEDYRLKLEDMRQLLEAQRRDWEVQLARRAKLEAAFEEMQRGTKK